MSAEKGLTINQQAVLEFLRDHPGFHSPSEIGRTVGGGKRESAWASPICKRLVKKNVVLRNDHGHYAAVVGILNQTQITDSFMGVLQSLEDDLSAGQGGPKDTPHVMGILTLLTPGDWCWSTSVCILSACPEVFPGIVGIRLSARTEIDTANVLQFVQDACAQLQAEDIRNLEHMVGVASNIPRMRWGYRNYYCAGTESLPSMIRLVEAGLVIQGKQTSNGTLFHATERGCRRAGLDDVHIRAMRDDRRLGLEAAIGMSASAENHLCPVFRTYFGQRGQVAKNL